MLFDGAFDRAVVSDLEESSDMAETLDFVESSDMMEMFVLEERKALLSTTGTLRTGALRTNII